MGKNKKMAALQKEWGSGWGQWKRGIVDTMDHDSESSQCHSCPPGWKGFPGGGAQADPGSAETEGKEKRREPFLMMSLFKELYQILASALPVF